MWATYDGKNPNLFEGKEMSAIDGEPMEKQPIHNKAIIDEKQTIVDGMNRALGLIYDVVHDDRVTHQGCRVALRRYFKELKGLSK